MNLSDGARRLNILVMFGFVLGLASCRSSEPTQTVKATDRPVRAETAESLQRLAKKPEDDVKRAGKGAPAKRTPGACAPDTRGQRTDAALRAKLGNKLDAIWARERALTTRPEWEAFMPSGEGSSDLKLVSLEMSNRAQAGHYLPKFNCVRIRFLAKQEPQRVSGMLTKGWGLAIPKKGGSLTGTTKDGSAISVSVGLNQDLLTQVDVALVPKSKLALTMPFGEGSDLLRFFRSQTLSAFEYGVYASARPGLKFPGLERAILLVGMDEKSVADRLNHSGFTKQERGEDLYVKDSETYTFRRYSKAYLSLFWQLRLTKDELRPLLLKSKASPRPTAR